MELSRGLEVLSPREEARLDLWLPLSLSPASPLLCVTLGSRAASESSAASDRTSRISPSR